MMHTVHTEIIAATAIGQSPEPRQTEVGAELSNITRGELRLRELLDKLEENLRPVLGADLGEGGCKGGERPAAPLAQHLRGVSESIDGFGDRVAGLLARLEV